MPNLLEKLFGSTSTEQREALKKQREEKLHKEQEIKAQKLQKKAELDAIYDGSLHEERKKVAKIKAKHQAERELKGQAGGQGFAGFAANFTKNMEESAKKGDMFDNPLFRDVQIQNKQDNKGFKLHRKKKINQGNIDLYNPLFR